MKKYIINLKDDDRAIHSKATINKKAKRRLYWFIEAGGSNSPLKYVPAADRAGFGEAGSMKFSMKTDSDGVCEHDEFRMSVCGLDTFKVSVGLKEDGSDKRTNEEYEVWRRVYFSVRYMDAKFLVTFGPLHDEYHKHGIWPEQIAPGGGPAKVALKDPITRYEDGYALIQPVSQSRLEARVLLVDRIWLAHQREFICKTKMRNFRIASFPQTGDESTTVDPGWMLWTGPKFATVTVGGVGIGTYDLAAYIQRAGDRAIAVNIPDGTPLATVLDEAASRGKLVYKFKVWFADVLNGFAQQSSGRILIANRNSSATSRPLAPRQGTVIHEMGHGLGMVPANVQEYNEFNGNVIPSGLKKHPTQYMNGGGHCKTNATGSNPNYIDGTCVMFHYGHDARTLEFCDSCAPVLKRRNLDRDGMLWPRKGD